MKNIKNVTPIDFNIKTKDTIYFKNKKIYPPFDENIKFDIKHNPYRWKIEYEKKVKKDVNVFENINASKDVDSLQLEVDPASEIPGTIEETKKESEVVETEVKPKRAIHSRRKLKK
jgi:hypothetical protein